MDEVAPDPRGPTRRGPRASENARLQRTHNDRERRHIEAAKLPSALRGDLDWIVMKCLEKDRNVATTTANGLASDLRRHLANEIVSARAPTDAYRFQKLFADTNWSLPQARRGGSVGAGRDCGTVQACERRGRNTSKAAAPRQARPVRRSPKRKPRRQRPSVISCNSYLVRQTLMLSKARIIPSANCSMIFPRVWQINSRTNPKSKLPCTPSSAEPIAGSVLPTRPSRTMIGR